MCGDALWCGAVVARGELRAFGLHLRLDEANSVVLNADIERTFRRGLDHWDTDKPFSTKRQGFF